LTDAWGDGRLTPDELDRRVSSSLAAADLDELGGLTADLPAPRPRDRKVVTVMGSSARSLARLPARTSVVTVFGKTVLDLRSAFVDAHERELRLYVLGGRQLVLVPEGVGVHVSGFVLMGTNEAAVPQTSTRAGRPLLHVRVVGMMGAATLVGGWRRAPAFRPEAHASRPDNSRPGVRQRRNNPNAVNSFVCGVLGVVPILGLIAVALSVGFGFVSLSEIKASRGAEVGRRLAIAGIVISAVITAAWMLYLALGRHG
jgi:hypothetical protein